MTTFGDLERIGRLAADEVREVGLVRPEALASLFVDSCVLELATLSDREVPLPVFAAAAVVTLANLAASGRAAVVLGIAGVPPLRHVAGGVDDDELDTIEAAVRAGAAPSGSLLAAPLVLAGDIVGFIAVGDLPEPMVRAGIVTSAADQIARGVARLVEAERVRRDLAAGRAFEAVAWIDERYDEAQLAELADALAALPDVLGAGLVLANARFGGPITVSAGLATGRAEISGHAIEVDGWTALRAELRWARRPDPGDLALVDRVIASAGKSVGRVERTIRLLESHEVDELTGLGNRRRGLRAMSAAQSWAERQGGSFAVALLGLVPTPGAYSIEGDDAVVATADCLARALRDYDTAVRWSDESFLLVCPATDVLGAVAVADRIGRSVREVLERLPGHVGAACALGVAVFPVAGDQQPTLVAAAESALAAAHGSASAYVVAEPAHAATVTW